MSVVLGLDIGKQKTGIAKADSLGIVIKPLKTIKTIDLFLELETLMQDFVIEKLVIGEPINFQKGNNDNFVFIQTIIEKLKKQFSHLEISSINESFTSKEASEILKQQGIKINKDNKSLVDMYAAAIILEQYFLHTN